MGKREKKKKRKEVKFDVVPCGNPDCTECDPDPNGGIEVRVSSDTTLDTTATNLDGKFNAILQGLRDRCIEASMEMDSEMLLRYCVQIGEHAMIAMSHISRSNEVLDILLDRMNCRNAKGTDDGETAEVPRTDR